MANKNFDRLTKLLRGFLIFGSLFMLVEALVYFLNLKLFDIYKVWPSSAITYSTWTSYYFASMALFLSALLYMVQKDLIKYINIIKLLTTGTALYGTLFWFGVFFTNFDNVYQGISSLSLWLPSYKLLLAVEATLLYVFSLCSFIWLKTHD